MESKEDTKTDILRILDTEELELRDSFQLESCLGSERQRYCRLIPIDKKSGEKRFLKILMSERPEDRESFNREAVVTDYLNSETNIPAQRVYNFNFTGPRPYAVFEALPEENQRNFIEKPGVVSLGEEYAPGCIEHLLKIHKNIRKIPSNIKERLQGCKVLDSYQGLYEDIEGILDKEVNPLDAQRETFHQTMNRRLGIPNFRDIALELIREKEQVIKDAETDRDFLVHGDLSPVNFCYNNGRIQFLDWEWTSLSNNEVLAMVYDYGNLRARCWDNKDFKNFLDDAIFDSNRIRPERSEAIISLGILRSHCLLAGFFENYPQEKQLQPDETERRESTEADIRKAFKI